MGSYTYTEVIQMPTIKNFLHTSYHNRDEWSLYPDFARKYFEGYEDEELSTLTANNWCINTESWKEFGEIFASFAKKEDKIVYFVNEDDYASVEVYTLTAFAEKAEWIKEFIQECFGFSEEQTKTMKTKNLVAIKQTL